MKEKLFCNRTLNLRSIKAIGYDMDYTLVHYRVEDWERQAYQYIKQHFLAAGWPVQKLEFEPQRVARGLVIDREMGNLVKANRFGYVKRAMHGTGELSFDAHREAYSRTIVDLHERRWVFLNTLFSLSEACIFAQLVDLLDRREVPEVLGYGQLYDRVRSVIDTAHMEGRLKADIMAEPERFVDLDPATALALLDQRHAGKKLMLITNSEWFYTGFMMSYCFDRFLPKPMTWRDLFDLVIVAAGKPAFFSGPRPFYEVATPEGLLRPLHGNETFTPGAAYYGGSAAGVEKHLNLSGGEILYVGDHMFGDVRESKNALRWRTALVLRELEDEIDAVASFQGSEQWLAERMAKKEELASEQDQVRLGLQRLRGQYAAADAVGSRAGADAELQARYDSLRAQQLKLDEEIAPVAAKSSQLGNFHWGLLMRTGNDKSMLAFQLERYADIYTSRVSNFLHATPFAYLRSPRGSLPHDL